MILSLIAAVPYFLLLSSTIIITPVSGDYAAGTEAVSNYEQVAAALGSDDDEEQQQQSSSAGGPLLVVDDLLMADAATSLAPNTATASGSCQDTPRQLRMLAIAQRSIILYCDVSPAVAAHDHLIQWKREPDLAPIFARQGAFLPYIHPSYEGRLSIVDDALLKIDPVIDSDEGWYRCEIHFTRPEMCPRTPNRVHLSVQSHPQLITNDSSPEQVNRPVGTSEVALRCVFSGTPQPEVTWTKYSWHRGYEVLRPSSRIKITPSSLTIKGFTKNDSGRYQCRAANLVGEATYQISLVSDGTVVLIVPPSNVTVDEGDEAVFHCQVDGHPAGVKYRWFRDGVEIAFPPPLASISSSEDGGVSNSNDEPIRTRLDRFTAIHSGQSSVLVINPTTRKDSAYYSCEGYNTEASVRTPEALLSVKFKPNFINMKPFVFLPLGLSVNLTCSAEANPPITKYSWAKGNNFDITGTRFRFSDDGRVLNIQNVSRDDAGNYICFVTNDYATDKFEIEVQTTDPPVFTAVPRPLTQVLKGSGVTVACKATASIIPVISWLKDGQPLVTSNRVQVNDGNLIIHDVNLDDQGEYLCLAQNSAATVMQKTRIVVEDEGRPHAPRNLTVETGTYSATLTWLPAYNRGLQSYIVQYRLIATPDMKISSNRPVSPPPWQQMRVFPEGGLTFTIYNLLSNSTYEFRVMARSHEPGDGLYSQPVVERTKATTLSGNRKLSPVYEDDSFVEDFANAPPPPPDSYLLSSIIRTSSSHQPSTATLQTLATPNPPKATVSDRSVDLVNHPESLQYAGPKPPAPRNVTGTALPRLITLRWAPPDNSTLTSATKQLMPPTYTCYTIEYMAGQDGEWRQLANVSAATDSFVLSNPTPKVVYRFRIAACNEKTIGYYSETIVLTSEETGNLMQVPTETALLGIAGCAVVLIVIISVVVICVRYNRAPSPYDRHRQRQCKFANMDGSSTASPIASTPPNKQQQQLLLGNGSSSNYLNGHGGGLLTTANGKMPNGKSLNGLNGMANGNGSIKVGCPTSNSMGSCNGGLLLGSSSSSNSGGTATLPKNGNNGEWPLSPTNRPVQQRSSTSSAPAATPRQQQSFGFVTGCRHQQQQATGASPGAHCRYCRGSSLVKLHQQQQQVVFPPTAHKKHQRHHGSSSSSSSASSSGGRDAGDEDGGAAMIPCNNSDEADEMAQCLSKNPQPINNKYYSSRIVRPLGRLETILLMDESVVDSPRQQQHILVRQAPSNCRHQPMAAAIMDGDYDNISQICDTCPVVAVDGLYVRSRSPVGRYLDGNLRLLNTSSTAVANMATVNQHGGKSNNSSTTTTDAASRASSIESGEAGQTSSYSNLANSNNENPQSPCLCEMRTPPMSSHHLRPPGALLVNIVTPPSSQHLSPSKVVTFAPPPEDLSVVPETRI